MAVRAEVTPPRLALHAALLLLAICAAYANSFWGEFVLDDALEVGQNYRLLRGEGVVDFVLFGNGLPARPVPYLTFYLNTVCHGASVAGYHAVNLAIHCVNALLLTALFRGSLRRGGWSERDAAVAAFAATLIWALHPLQTQAITYIYQRLESLMATFFLGTMVAFMRSTRSAHPALWRWVSVASCALAMASKEVAIVAPLLVLLWDRAFLAGSWRGLLRDRGAYYLSLAATGVIAVALVVAQKPAYAEFQLPEDHPIQHTGLEHLFSQPGVLLWYTRLFFLPTQLTFDYNWPVERSVAHALPGMLLLLTVLAGVGFLALKRPRLGLLGLSFFLILAPTSSVMPVSAIAAEHRMYLPSASLAMASVLALIAGARFLLGQQRAARLAAVGWLLLVALSGTLGAATHLRNRDYFSKIALWEDCVAKAPHNWVARFRYGSELQREGRPKEAIEQYRKSLEYYPFDLARSNLAVTLFEVGDHAEAERGLRELVRDSPDFAYGHANLGVVVSRSNPTEAIACFERAIQINPEHAAALSGLGSLVMDSDPSRARKLLTRAVELNPTDVIAYNNLGMLLFREGNLQHAKLCFQAALVIDPTCDGAKRNLESTERAERGER